ncbi:UNVERIFIED_CONTAM: hypothetical protein Slati_3843200 [Sesamum latifolium]|uniref:Uncharacterized protein n=1 Tax=Sesamum latifolium TaxID=2727402 RepID=A0AAW2TLA7_9LAMI
MHNRRVNGLCFNCDECFILCNHCKPKQFFLLLADEDAQLESPTFLDPEDIFGPSSEFPSPPMPVSLLRQSAPPDGSYFQLLTDAALGVFSPCTLRLSTTILGRPVFVLVDSGSSHNIL